MTLVQPIVDGLYRIPLGFVNAFVIARPNQLTLIDSGMPGSADRIEKALLAIGFDIADLQHILITHCHPDHSGSLAEIQRRAPHAQTWMHAEDAALVRRGIGVRPDPPLRPAPGWHNFLLWHLLVRRISPQIAPARVDHHVCNGQQLAIAGGIRVIHAPGHTRGHVCFLWQTAGGVLFVGDAAACLFNPAYSVVYEDFELGKQSLLELDAQAFEYACFGHGKTLIRCASKQLRAAFVRRARTELMPAADLG